ncbi:MAG: phosphatase PAP2 family protein [Oscillospiraceae bacterium]|nr:phosphatase PAP2 family protein [Oscillospiraceae bacterium]
MEILYWFESIRMPVLDAVMSFITHLGEETFFMAAALYVFWCADKRKGYYLLSVGFAGTLVNQWLKIVFRVPRPWVRDPNFTIVEQARAEAGGYSFPSGHTQCAAGLFGGVARVSRRWWVRICCIIALLSVAVSRLYLGVHTPADVAVSLLAAAILIFLLHPVMDSTLWFPNRMYFITGGMMAVSFAFIGFMRFFPFPADTDPENLVEALRNAYKMAGAVTGMMIVYAFDSRLLQFPNRAPWWGQAVKLAAGLALVVAVKTALKAPLLSLFSGNPAADAVRYLLVVLTAGCVWPMTFRFFERYD